MLYEVITWLEQMSWHKYMCCFGLLCAAMAAVPDDLELVTRVYVANVCPLATKPDAYICLVHSLFFVNIKNLGVIV